MAASHGVPRVSEVDPPTEEAQKRTQQQIADYRSLVAQVNERVNHKVYNRETLSLTSKLLTRNPEYYTVWNYRRRILDSEIDVIKPQVGEGSSANEAISKLLSVELAFLLPLMMKFPKCYWLWNHRAWVLRQSSTLLPTSAAQKFWTEELGLVNKMLGRDSRNFHGWGYRRKIVAELERLGVADGHGSSMAEAEYEYTRKMIGQNLSNFSAWHTRSKMITRMMDERQAGTEERQKMLNKELDLIHDALIDPQDQSLWFYHQSLVMAFDPNAASGSIVPDLTTKDRLNYLESEIDYVLEMIDGAEDVKWIYLALIQLSSLYHQQSDRWPAKVDEKTVSGWMKRLQSLDPLRKNRWHDWSEEIRISVA